MVGFHRASLSYLIPIMISAATLDRSLQASLMYSARANNVLPSKALVPFEATSLGDSSCTVMTASRSGIDVVVLSKEVAMDTGHEDCDCIVVSMVVAITRAISAISF